MSVYEVKFVDTTNGLAATTKKPLIGSNERDKSDWFSAEHERYL